MKLAQKRDIARQLRDEGKLHATGTEIVRMTNDDLDPILIANGYDIDAEDAPDTVKTRQTSGDNRQLAALAALSELLAPQSPGVDSELLEALEERIAILETQSRPREVVVKNPASGSSVNVGLTHYKFDELLACVMSGIPAFLSGPPGSFKTSTAEKVASALGLECSAISVCQQTTAVALLGYMDATGTYRATEFRKRYERGGVFILDEIDNGNANVLSVLNSALANGSCAFPDGMVKRHDDFRLIATGNTVGKGGNAQFIGRCALDSATLDRLALIAWPYDIAMERELCPDKDWVEKVIQYRKSAEAMGSRAIISPRASFDGAKLIAAGLSVETVEDMTVFRGLSPEEKQKIKSGANV